MISALATTSQTTSAPNFSATNSSTKDGNLNLGATNPTPSSSTVHIPYRDSKLTRLLQNSLNGSSKTIIILTISAAKQHLSETISTLKFGERARLIKITPKVHQTMAEKDENLRETIKDLRHQIKLLQQTISKMQEEQHPMLPQLSSSRLNQILNSPDVKVATPIKEDAPVPAPVSTICEICQSFIDQNVNGKKSEPAVEEKEEIEVEKKKKTPQKKSTNKRKKQEKREVESEDEGEEDQENSGYNRNFLFFPSKQKDDDDDEEERSEEEEDEYENSKDNSEEEDVSDRCGICNMNEEESDQLKQDTGEELGFFINCDGNCGNKYHIRCIGLVGDGGQYTMPDGEWFCTICETQLQDGIVSNILVPNDDQEADNEEEEKEKAIGVENEEEKASELDHIASVEADESTFQIPSEVQKELEGSSTPSKKQTSASSNLVSALQTLHCRYEIMRKERNRILMHWQQEKKMQQHIEQLKQKKQAKDFEERQRFEDEKQHFNSTIKSLEDENSVLRNCLQEIQQTIAQQNHHSTNSLSQSYGNQSWVSLSKSVEIQDFLFPKYSRKFADNPDIDDNHAIDKDRDTSNENGSSPTSELDNTINKTKSPKGNNATGEKFRASKSFRDNEERPLEESLTHSKSNSSLPPYPALSQKGNAKSDAATKSNSEASSIPPKEASRFIDPLRNRLSELLELVKQEADSYAEIRNKYQSREEHRHELRQSANK